MFTKYTFHFYIIIVVAMFVVSSKLEAQEYSDLVRHGYWQNNEIDYIRNEIGVKFITTINDDTLASITNIVNGNVSRRYDDIKWVVIQLSDTSDDALDALQLIINHPSIHEAVPMALLKAQSSPPNDTYWQNQWYLDSVSTSIPGHSPQLQILKAWNFTKGWSDVVLAILDSGIPYGADSTGHLVFKHDDLKGDRFINGGNWVQYDNAFDGGNPPISINDLVGHGTHVAGLAGATINNSTGIVGVAPNCKMYIAKVLGSPTLAATCLSIKNGIYAVVDTARNNPSKRYVINLSAGVFGENPDLESGVAYAYNNNVTIVAAAGNDNKTIHYPARYSAEYSNVVAVGAISRADVRSHYSNYGNALNICAAGGDDLNCTPTCDSTDWVFSTYLNNGYTSLEGTSMATPLVSGAVALVLSVQPNLTPSQVRDVLQTTAFDLGAYGRDQYYGYGRVNAYAALRKVSTPNIIFPDNETVVPNPPLLTWHKIRTAASYRVQLSMSSTFATILADSSGITDTTKIFYGLSDTNTFYWRVCSITSDTGISDWSSTASFKLLQPPPVPTIVSPSNNATSIGNPVTLKWSVTNTAVSYHIEVDLDTNFTSPIFTDTSGIIDTLFSLSGLTENTKYFWRVSGVNSAGEGSYSLIRSFTTGATPSDPSLVYPANLAVSVEQYVTFRWNHTAFADSFFLQVDLDTNFTSPIFKDIRNITDTSNLVTGLSYITTYFWRVKSVNTGYGGGSWSSVRSFTTAPNKPTTFLPENYAVISNPPTLYWLRVTGAISYRVQISTVSDFASIYCDSSGITDSVKVINGLPGATVYYWRVKTIASGNGESIWSTVYSFKVTPPPPPELTGNTYNTGSGILYPKPTWTAVTGWGTVGYKLYHYGWGLGFLKYTGTDLYYIDTDITIGEGDIYAYYFVRSYSTVDNALSSPSDTVEYLTDVSQAKQRIKNDVVALPTEFSLGDNFPNPFNPMTTIYYALPEDIQVHIAVYDVLGKELVVLVDGFVNAGYKTVTFDASGIPSGVYYYRMNAGTFSYVKKMILMK